MGFGQRQKKLGSHLKNWAEGQKTGQPCGATVCGFTDVNCIYRTKNLAETNPGSESVYLRHS